MRTCRDDFSGRHQGARTGALYAVLDAHQKHVPYESMVILALHPSLLRHSPNKALYSAPPTAFTRILLVCIPTVPV